MQLSWLHVSDYHNLAWKSIVKHQGIVSVTETSPKRRQFFSKMLNLSFFQKVQNFVLFGPYNFVQISPACDPNVYQIVYGVISNVSISNSKIKCLFSVNLPLKLFPATTNVDIKSL